MFASTSCGGWSPTPPAREAARTAAEKRWSSDLHNRYVDDADAYALIIDAIDTAIQEAATTAELQKRGSGLPTILRLIDQRQSSKLTPPTAEATP